MQAWITLWPSIFTLWQIGRVMAMWVIALFQKKREWGVSVQVFEKWHLVLCQSDCWCWIKIYNGLLKVTVTYTFHPFSKPLSCTGSQGALHCPITGMASTHESVHTIHISSFQFIWLAFPWIEERNQKTQANTENMWANSNLIYWGDSANHRAPLSRSWFLF